MQNTNKTIGFNQENWLILNTTSSTNQYAKELLSKSTPVLDGTVIMAENQTAGKGQKTNVWESEPGKNLTFSFILDSSFLSIDKQYLLNQFISLSIYDFLVEIPCLVPFIKWPNDLYINEKKIGGILIENLIAGNKHKHSIIGVGLNINQTDFSSNLSRATSLKIETNQEFDLYFILKRILNKFQHRLNQLKSLTFELIEEEYTKNLLGFKQLRYFRHLDRTFQGFISGTGPQGELKIQVENKEEFFEINELVFLF